MPVRSSRLLRDVSVIFAGTFVLFSACGEPDCELTQSCAVSNVDGDPGGAGGSGAGNDQDLPGAAGASTGGQAPACESYKDCTVWSEEQPVACIEKQCTFLTSEHCQAVIGRWRDDTAVRIGAFGSFAGNVENSLTYLHYRLAIDSFQNSQWPRRDGTSYPIAMILCDSATSTDAEENFEGIRAGAEHLIEDLKVPGVIAFLLPTDLGEIFEEFVSKPKKPVLFLNPGGGTKSLVALNWDQRLWHTLGQPSDYVPAFVAAMKEVDSLAKARWPDVTETRIALVYDADGVDEAFRLRLTENEDFIAFTSPKKELAEPTYRAFSLAAGTASTAAAILDYEPHVVISLVGNEVAPFMEQLEVPWIRDEEAGVLDGPMITKLPYFVFSPTAIYNLALREHFDFIDYNASLVSTFTMDRYIAVGAKSPTGAGRSAYQTDWSEAHPGTQATFENVFDAVYLMVYALQAAGPPTDLSTLDLQKGFLRLLGQEGDPEILVGRAHLAESLFQLANPNVERFRFVGAMGPARYDSLTGVQPAEPVISCVREQSQVWKFAEPTHGIDDAGGLVSLAGASELTFHEECFGAPLAPVDQ